MDHALHKMTFLDLELDDWIDPSLPSNCWAVGESIPAEPTGPTFSLSSWSAAEPRHDKDR